LPESQACNAQRNPEDEDHDAQTDVQPIALDEEIRRERRDRWQNECQDRRKVGGMDRRCAGTHATDHQGEDDLMRVVDRSEYERSAAP
jgi:hypothetical protein